MGWQNGQIHCRFCTNKSDVNNQIWYQPKYNCNRLETDFDKIFNPIDVKLRKIKKILWGPMKENQTENKAKKHFLKLGFIQKDTEVTKNIHTLSRCDINVYCIGYCLNWTCK